MVKKLLVTLGAILLVAACAGSPRMTPSERLEWYRANSGEPVRGFQYTGRIWRWTALGDSALALWTRSNRGYLIEFFGRCPDLSFAASITVSNRVGRVSAGFDSITVHRMGTSGSRCRISTIRPINTRIVDESVQEMEEVEWVDRDPSEPAEPQ